MRLTSKRVGAKRRRNFGVWRQLLRIYPIKSFSRCSDSRPHRHRWPAGVRGPAMPGRSADSCRKRSYRYAGRPARPHRGGRCVAARPRRSSDDGRLAATQSGASAGHRLRPIEARQGRLRTPDTDAAFTPRCTASSVSSDRHPSLGLCLDGDRIAAFPRPFSCTCHSAARTPVESGAAATVTGGHDPCDRAGTAPGRLRRVEGGARF